MTPRQLLGSKSQESDFAQSLLTASRGLRIGGSLANSELQYVSQAHGRLWLGSQARRVALRVPSRRQVELQWRRTHKEVLQRLLGQWVVLEGERIVASGPSLAEAVRQARARGIRVPYVFQVENVDRDTATIGL